MNHSDRVASDVAVDLSIILCTRNRVHALRACLAALDLQEVAEVHGEVILVDNGSTDETSAVMERFAAQAEGQVPVQRIHVAEPGLSRARNAGVRTARGQVLVFLDDDVYLGENYLRIARNVLDVYELDYCGGRILLYDPSDADYGCSRGEAFRRIPPGSFVHPNLMQGANMIIHRRVFDRVGLFDPRLGAGMQFRCEDLDMIARASLAGFVGAHVPELVVYHHHRRKPGADIEKLIRDNDYARGAFFAKFILEGHMHYLQGWMRRSIRPRRLRWTVKRLPNTFREAQGALAYARVYGVRDGYVNGRGASVPQLRDGVEAGFVRVE